MGVGEGPQQWQEGGGQREGDQARMTVNFEDLPVFYLLFDFK